MGSSIFKIIFLSTLSEKTWACAACGFGDDGSRWGYILTTGLMTFLPLTLFAVLIYFIRKHIKKNNTGPQISSSDSESST